MDYAKGTGRLWLALLSMVMFLGLAGCGKEAEDVDDTLSSAQCRVAFRLSGGTRAGLSANGRALTELWVFDYQGGQLVQKMHKVADDGNFEDIALTMSYGQHTVYFVASRGQGAAVDEAAHTINWTKVSDTFRGVCELTVSRATGEQVVTLKRCVTELVVEVTDALPATVKTLRVTPGSWYYGLDYVSGQPAGLTTDKAIDIGLLFSSSSASGTTIGVYGFSAVDEWQTDVEVAALDEAGAAVSSVTLPGVTFARNRRTVETGRLFSGSAGFKVSIDDGWQEDRTGTY
jgi:hypothetical protein